jgi:hypothetical protein
MTIFDVKALLIAFLNNPLKMREENFASNYDIFSGKAKILTSTIDEIHTGSLWEPAQRKYCGDNPDVFPLALVCFYDKTNTDVFGSLSCAPFMCTPTFLNRVVAMMTQITWNWVMSPILDMERVQPNHRHQK